MTSIGGTRTGESTPLGEPAAFDGGLTEIAPGTWAWLQPNGGLGESNAGLVVGEGESLLIDTLWDAKLTGAMLAVIEPLAAEREAPITTLLNTHGDGDHWYGNGLIPSKVGIVATDAAAHQMREEPPALLTRLSPVGTIASLLARVPLLPGRPVLRGLAAFNSALGRYQFGDGLSPRRPDHPFSGSVRLDVGGRLVEVIEVGPAHTPGDAIAWVSDARVIFAGDIVFNGVVPIMWAGPVENWIGALELIEQHEPEVVVGGHGPPCGVAEIGILRDYWVWLRAKVAAAGDEKPAELAERLIRSRAWRGKPWSEWRNPERTVVNVARIRAAMDGDRGGLSTAGRIRLIAAMGALAERLAA